jgi:hypothetical protein
MNTKNAESAEATKVEAAKAEVLKAPAREIDAIAQVAVRLSPAYKIHKTASTTFRCLTLAADEAINWKKGLVYLIARYSKGVNLEMWMYSTKGGAHLADYNDLIRPLATGAIKAESLGKALKLRIQLADTMTDEEVEVAIKGMMDAVEPTLQAIREKIVIAVSKKETKKTAKAAAPADETPAPQVPADATAPAAEGEPAMSKRQLKKAAKRAAKAGAAA